MTANKTFQALVDRIIPADDYPSGWQAGAGDFIERILATDLAGSAPLVEAGLELLRQEAQARHHGAEFADLPATAQDALVEDLLAGKTTVEWGDIAPEKFASLMVQLCAQGFYGDPENGGNRDAVSWEMIGYRVLPPGTSLAAGRFDPTATGVVGQHRRQLRRHRGRLRRGRWHSSLRAGRGGL